MGEFLVGILCCMFTALVFFLGQMSANAEIATECQRQGSFYVGNKTFNCTLKEIIR